MTALAHCRVFLFTPGNRPDRFPKAAATGADALILDLEDAVSSAEKDSARATLIAHFAADFRKNLAPGQLCGLRVNNVHTQAGLRDLEALAASRVAPDFIFVPKVESAFEARLYTRHLTGEQSNVLLVCMIESARGLESAIDIAMADPRVQSLALGGLDLAVDLGAEPSWEPLYAARARVVQAAAVAGIGAIDLPYPSLDDLDGLDAQARRVRAMGYTGKLAIHPKQLAPIVAAFSPSAEEVAEAEAIVAAFVAAKGNVCEYRGKMVEGPVVRAAERTLAQARRGGGA